MKKNAPNAYNNSRARSSSAGSRTPRINGTKGSSSSSVTRSTPKPQARPATVRTGVKSTASSQKSGVGRTIGIVACLLVVVVAVGVGCVYFSKEKTEEEKKVSIVMADGTTQEKTVGELRTELTANTFYKGIVIDGIDMGGKTKEEATGLLYTNLNQNPVNLDLKLKLNDIEYPVDLSSLKFDNNAEEVVSEAFNYGRPTENATSAELLDCYNKMQALSTAPVTYTTEIKINTDGLSEAVTSLLEPFNKEAVDAEIKDFNFETLQFDATESSEGCIVNIDKAIADSKALLEGGTYEGVIDVESQTIEPELKSEDVTSGYGLLSTASSETTWNSNRNNNINQACLNISEKVKVLKPGESFSFNDTVGQRTADRGFLTAGTYQNGKVVDDYGGGICQVSTMIYQAALKADLEIVERHNHMFTGSYFDPGLDATVDWGNLDFKFSNNTGFPIALSIGFDSENRIITVCLYGKLPEDGGHIELASEVISTNAPSSGTTYIADPTRHVGDNSAPEGDYHVGKTAKAYKVRFDADGNEVARELIVDPDGSEVSVYKSSVATVMVGVLNDDGSIAAMDPNTGAVAAPEVPPEETTLDPNDPNATAESNVIPDESVIPTDPTDTQPTETQPTDTQPTETQPTETQPTETQPTETQPQPTEPAPTEPQVQEQPPEDTYESTPPME